jgi:lipopolysaccharide/colanic/teichoic acid biosynthesis glycosyltransferase
MPRTQWRASAPARPVEPQPAHEHRAPAPPAGAYTTVKAVFDRGCAVVILILASPVILLTMLAVKLTSAGPAAYSQTRMGRNGKPFTIYKIRTMLHNCESQSGARWSTPGDARVTPVGKFLRASHLDELPQLWNVIRGDMSLVGPRPERPEFVPALERFLPHYCDRLSVKQGLTGMAQVHLPPDTDFKSVERKLTFDLYYLRHLSFWLDVRLIACTAPHALGLPFRITAPLCGVPGKDEVEGGYGP